MSNKIRKYVSLLLIFSFVFSLNIWVSAGTSKAELDIKVERGTDSGENIQILTVTGKFDNFADGEYALLKIFNKGANEDALTIDDYKYIGHAKINPDGSFKHSFEFTEQGDFTFTLTSHTKTLKTSEYYIADLTAITALIDGLNNGTISSLDAKVNVDTNNKELMFDTKLYEKFSDETKLLIWSNMVSEIGTGFNIDNIYDTFNKYTIIDGINAAISSDVVKNIIERYDEAYLNLDSLSVNDIRLNMTSTELSTLYGLMINQNFADFNSIKTRFNDSVILSKYKNMSNFMNIADLLSDLKTELDIAVEMSQYESLSDTNKKVVCLYLSNERNNVNSIYDTSDGLKGKLKYALNNLPLLVKLYSTPQTGGGGGGTTSNVQISNDYVEKNDTDDVVYSSSLSDLNEVSWASEAINALYEKGVINGKSSGKYMPYDNVTRAEMTKMISVALGIFNENAESDFLDIKNHWGYRYISSVANKGYIVGISETEFSADAEITRQDTAVILYRIIQYLAKTKKVENLTVSYTDMNEISEYARNSVIMLSEYNILNGFDDGSFKPNDSLNRAQAAVVIHKLLDFINN